MPVWEGHAHFPRLGSKLIWLEMLDKEQDWLKSLNNNTHKELLNVLDLYLPRLVRVKRRPDENLWLKFLPRELLCWLLTLSLFIRARQMRTLSPFTFKKSPNARSCGDRNRGEADRSLLTTLDLHVQILDALFLLCRCSMRLYASQRAGDSTYSISVFLSFLLSCYFLILVISDSIVILVFDSYDIMRDAYMWYCSNHDLLQLDL